MRKLIVTLAALILPQNVVAQEVKGSDEISPELRALLTRLRDDAKSKSSNTRASAYKAMGELGDKGKHVFKDLAIGMTDLVPSVNVAAFDALTKLDKKSAEDAIQCLVAAEKADYNAIQKQGKESAYLSPVIMAGVIRARTQKEGISTRLIQKATICLAEIDPDDEKVNSFIFSMMGNKIADLRELACGLLPKLKFRKSAFKPTLAIILNIEEEENVKIQAIKSLPEVTEESTKKAALAALEVYRIGKSENLRKAANAAYEAINSK